MSDEREKCAEILARHLEGRLQSKEALLNALLEARDLARREALEEAANVIEGWESLWKEALADIRRQSLIVGYSERLLEPPVQIVVLRPSVTLTAITSFTTLIAVTSPRPTPKHGSVWTTMR